MCYNKCMAFRSSSPLPEFDAPSFVCELLNKRRKLAAFDQAMLTELCWWVDAWLDSGPNMRRMCRTIEAAKSHLLLASGVCTYTITDSGLLFATPFPAGGIAGDPDPADVALRLFRQLVLHPECEKLCGPCPTCVKYFLKKTRHRVKYCSRLCGSYTTALAANQKRNDDLHAELLRLSREALSAYVQKRRKQTWEAWTVSYLKKRGQIRKAKSLHRWVNDEKTEAGSGLKLPPEIEAKQPKSAQRRNHNG
jgi:hypothetical protein